MVMRIFLAFEQRSAQASASLPSKLHAENRTWGSVWRLQPRSLQGWRGGVVRLRSWGYSDRIYEGIDVEMTAEIESAGEHLCSGRGVGTKTTGAGKR